jgi:hypothetical protein
MRELEARQGEGSRGGEDLKRERGGDTNAQGDASRRSASARGESSRGGHESRRRARARCECWMRFEARHMRRGEVKAGGERASETRRGKGSRIGEGYRRVERGLEARDVGKAMARDRGKARAMALGKSRTLKEARARGDARQVAS